MGIICGFKSPQTAVGILAYAIFVQGKSGNVYPGIVSSIYSSPLVAQLHCLYVDSQGNSYVGGNTISPATSNYIVKATSDAVTSAFLDVYPLMHAKGTVWNIFGDSNGNIYYSDGSYCVYSSTSMGYSAPYSCVYGTGTSGTWIPDGLPASATNMNFAQGLFIDSTGNMYVSDSAFCVVRRFMLPSGIVTTLAGSTGNTAGTCATSSDTSKATATPLNCPTGIWLDTAGNLYIAEAHSHKVRLVTKGTSIVWTVAGNGSSSFDNIVSSATSVAFPTPYSVSVDLSGSIYTGDVSGFACAIRKIVPEGIEYTYVGGSCGVPRADGADSNTIQIGPYIEGLFVNSKYELYFADYSSGYWVKVSNPLQSGSSVGTINQIFTSRYINEPTAIYVDTNNCIYVGGRSAASSSNNYIAKVFENGTIINFLDAYPIMYYPTLVLSIFGDSAGSIYYSDSAYCIYKSTRQGLSTPKQCIMGNGVRYNYVPDGYPSNATSVTFPYSLYIDSSNNMYVSDNYFCSVRKFMLPHGLVYTVIGQGGCAASPDGTPAISASLLTPYGICLDTLGNLFVAETGNNRVRVISISSGKLETIAGNGTTKYLQDGVAATSTGVPQPTAVAVDQVGNIFVGDFDGNDFRVRKILPNGIITTYVGTGLRGTVDTVGLSGAASAIGNEVIGLFARDDKLFVADYDNNKILAVKGSYYPTPAPTEHPTKPSSSTNNVILSSINLVPNLGFSLRGNRHGDLYGFSVANAGDINGDGFADVLVGTDQSGPGYPYLIFGSKSSFPSTHLSNLTLEQGFSIDGPSSTALGYALAGGGDVNGDNYDDIVIGQFGADGHAGRTYIIYGKASGFTNVTLGRLTKEQGCIIYGVSSSDDSGYAVAGGGDINGDGFDDILIGAFQADGLAGITYVVFGNSSLPLSIQLSALQFYQGFQIKGNAAGDRSGNSVAFAGDVNGDHYDDIIIGAYNALNNAGAAYIILGTAGFSSTINLAALSSSMGFEIAGTNSGDHVGISVSTAGDMNGDGLSEVIIGSDSGNSYIIFGKKEGFSNIALTSMSSDEGISVRGCGSSVSNAGDCNGDGYSDVIVSGSYVVFGQAGFTSDVILSTMSQSQGFYIAGSVSVVAGGGDVNGDGYSDLILGYPNAASNLGELYVVFGNTYPGFPSSQPTSQPSAIPSNFPSRRPSSQPSEQPSRVPTLQPNLKPSNQPSEQPRSRPSDQPTTIPSRQPATQPSVVPSQTPSLAPSRHPSSQPSVHPSKTPTRLPSSHPSINPSGLPSRYPTSQPTALPSIAPTFVPSGLPSCRPSCQPTWLPSSGPSVQPVGQPSISPSSFPSSCPSDAPTSKPTSIPSSIPTWLPSSRPSNSPSASPTSIPSALPTGLPTDHPTIQPSEIPSVKPTRLPSRVPTSIPLSLPTDTPSVQPIATPTRQPTRSPTVQPSGGPTDYPTSRPTTKPNCYPSSMPSLIPSGQPMGTPTLQPTRSPSLHAQQVYVQTAKLSNDGNSIVAKLNRNLSLFLPTMSKLDCCSLFIISDCAIVWCEIVDNRTIVVRETQLAFKLSIGSEFGLLVDETSLLVKACMSETCPFQFVGVNVTIISPYEPLAPNVILQGNPQIGMCSGWTIDATKTTGALRRRWTNVTIDLSPNNANASIIVKFVQQNFITSSPFTIPNNLLSAGMYYSLSIVLCNFVGGRAKGVVSTIVSSHGSVPSVSIAGDSIRSLYNNASLTLSSLAYVTLCNGNVRYSGLQYNWLVDYANGSRSNIVSKSKNPSQFYALPYVWNTGNEYSVILTVIDITTSQSNSASVIVNVPRSDLVAIISPIPPKKLSLGQVLNLDGSESYDPDRSRSTQEKLLYLWGCRSMNHCTCPFEVQDVTSSNVQLVTKNLTYANTTVQIMLTVSQGNNRNSSASVRFTIVGFSTPLVSILTTEQSVTNVNYQNSFSLVGSVVSSKQSVAGWSLQGSISMTILTSAPYSSTVTPSHMSTLTLYIRAGALSPAGTYSFALNCNGVSSKIIVTTASPPAGGVLVIRPLVGKSLLTEFTASTLNWIDNNLPMSYSFYYSSVGSSSLVLQPQSEYTYCTSQLPIGVSSANYSLNISVYVMNNLGISASVQRRAQIFPTKISNPSALVQSMLQNATSVAEIFRSVSLLTTTLNSVNCTLNCTDHVSSQQIAREKLLQGIHSGLIQSNINAQSLSDSANSINAVVRATVDLTQVSAQQVTNLSQTILQQALNIPSVNVTSIAALLPPINNVITLFSAPQTTNVTIHTAVHQLSQAVNSLTTFCDLLQTQSLPQSVEVDFIFPTFRIASAVFSSLSNASKQTMTVPETNEGLPTLATINTTARDNRNIYLQLVQLNHNIWKNNQSQLTSNILTVKTNSNDSVQIQLAHLDNRHYLSADSISQTVNCSENDWTVNNFTCPESNAILVFPCNGKAGTWKKHCPIVKPLCTQLNMTSQTVTNTSTCSVVDYNMNYTICECHSTLSVNHNRRKLSINNAVSNGAYSVTSMTEFVAQSTSDTFKAAKSFTSAGAIGKVYVVVCLFATLWGIGGVLMLYTWAAANYVEREKKRSIRSNRHSKFGKQPALSSENTMDSEAIITRLKAYVYSVIPRVFSNENWLHRLSAELTTHHGYLSLAFDLTNRRLSYVVIFKILTIFTINLFLIALLYDLNYPDNDGSCPNHTSQVACLARKSIFSKNQSYCSWNAQSSVCFYQAPNMSIQVALYCAVVVSLFTALSIRPLEYMFKMLSNPTAEAVRHEVVASVVSRARSSIANVGRRVSNAMLTFANNNSILPESVVSRNLAKIKSKLFIPSETATAYHEFRVIASDQMRNRLVTKIFHAVDVLYAENIDHQFIQFEDDFNLQRSSIPLELMARFDKAWHVNTRTEAFEDIIRQRILCYVRRQSIVTFLQQEIINTKRLGEEVIERIDSLPDSDAGITLLQLFIRDILGKRTIGAKIFSAKAEADFESSQVVSFSTKIFVLAILIGVNAFCVYYALLKGYVKGYDWQKQYAIACVVQIITEVTFFETLECVWMNFCLPSVGMNEVKRVHRVVDMAMKTMKVLLENDQSIAPPQLNVPKYFFASNIVARKFPTLPESLIVLSYRTCFPGEILHEDKLTQINSWSIKNILIFVASSFISVFAALITFIPFEVQRGLLRFFEPFLLGGIVLGFVIIQSNPVFLAFFCLFCVIVVVGAFYWYYFAKSKTKVAADNQELDIESLTIQQHHHQKNLDKRSNSEESNEDYDNDQNDSYDGDSDLESILELQRMLGEIILGNRGDKSEEEDRVENQTSDGQY